MDHPNVVNSDSSVSSELLASSHSQVGGMSSSDDDKEKTPNGIGEKDDAKVQYSKIFTYCVLAIVATALGVVTYLLTSEEEDDNFRSKVSAIFRDKYRFVSRIY
jgi:hypothetical protein